MSYISVLLIVTFGLAVAECLAAGHRRLQQQIYYVALLWVVFWSTAKYAYGPDITSYIPFWEHLRNPLVDLQNPKIYFESGFVVFCSLLKQIGCTFWGMTAVVSVLYFTAVALLFRQLKQYKTVALMVLVWLSNELFLVQIRQCMAVTMLIFCILFFQKKNYVWAVAFALLSMTMHKAAMVVVPLIGVLYLMRDVSVRKQAYVLWAILLCGMLFFPLHKILLPMVQHIFSDVAVVTSLEHHLELGKFFQKIFLFYFLTVLSLAYYKREDNENKTWSWIMWCSLGMVVCLYPYYFLLNRLRAFLVPFAVVYVVNELIESKVSDKLLRQIYTVVVFAFVGLNIVTMHTVRDELHSSTDRISLVFERRYHSEEYLQKRQLKVANDYWKYDYQQGINKGIRK